MGTKVPDIAVVDTHTLLWWLDGNARKLGRSARRFCETVDEGQGVAVIPAMVLVELSKAIWAGHVTLDESFDVFCHRLDVTPSRYQVASMSREIVAYSHALYAIPERGDRIIAATAAVHGHPVVTKDAAIARVVKTIW